MPIHSVYRLFAFIGTSFMYCIGAVNSPRLSDLLPISYRKVLLFSATSRIFVQFTNLAPLSGLSYCKDISDPDIRMLNKSANSLRFSSLRSPRSPLLYKKASQPRRQLLPTTLQPQPLTTQSGTMASYLGMFPTFGSRFQP